MTPLDPVARRSGADAVYAVLEAAPAAVVGVDATGLVDYLNPRAESVFGLRAEEVVGSPLERLVPEDLRGLRAVPTAGFGDQAVVRSGSDVRGLGCRRGDGSDFEAEATLIPLDTEQGPWVLLSLVDVSVRRRAAKRLEDLNRAYLTLAEINQAIVRAPDELTLFSETCRVAVEQCGYTGAWVGTIDSRLRTRPVASAGALDAYIEEVSPTIDAAHPSQTEVLRHISEGGTFFSDDYLVDQTTSPWHTLAAKHGVGAAATLPLQRGGRTIAMLTLYADRPHVFDEEIQSLLVTVGENVSFALDRLHAVRHLRASAAQRSQLSRRLVAAEEQERTRVAADLHDESVQALAAVDLRLGLLRRGLAETAPDLVPEVLAAQEAVGGVTAGLRDLLFELETADTSTPLPELLRDAAEHLLEPSSMRCSLQVDTRLWNHRSVLSQSDRGQALRTFKEVLLVLRQGGGPGNVDVWLVPDAEGLEISVAYDGKGVGLGASAGTDAPSLLAFLADRVELSGGWLRVEFDDHVSTVRFWLPYDPTAPPYRGPRY